MQKHNVFSLLLAIFALFFFCLHLFHSALLHFHRWMPVNGNACPDAKCSLRNKKSDQQKVVNWKGTFFFSYKSFAVRLVWSWWLSLSTSHLHTVSWLIADAASAAANFSAFNPPTFVRLFMFFVIVFCNPYRHTIAQRTRAYAHTPAWECSRKCQHLKQAIMLRMGCDSCASKKLILNEIRANNNKDKLWNRLSVSVGSTCTNNPFEWSLTSLESSSVM